MTVIRTIFRACRRARHVRLRQVLADRRDSDSLAAGCDVCPVPTALFSAHTRYAVFTFHDTTDILSGYLDAWQKEDVELDGVYSGFLGSPDQVAIIQRLYREYPTRCVWSTR